MTHRDDLVPHLPEEDLGYLHTPHEAYQKDEVKPDLTYCADSATKEDDACSNSCRPAGLHVGRGPPVLPGLVGMHVGRGPPRLFGPGPGHRGVCFPLPARVFSAELKLNCHPGPLSVYFQ